MTPPIAQDLTYGLLGEATYDRDLQEWRFQRVPGIGRTLHPLGPQRVLLDGSLPTDNPEITDRSSTENRKKTAQFVSTEPEFAGVSDLIGAFSQVSEAVIEAARSKEVLTSDLLSFGKSRVLQPSGAKGAHVEFLAVVAGKSGAAVSILCLREEKYQLKGLSTQSFSIPGVEEDEATCWTGPVSSPIQQICFSRTLEGAGSWLAVRNMHGISILHPRMTNNLIPSTSFADEAYGNATAASSSYLDANHIADIALEDTESEAYTDVCFNPWLEEQIAVLDSSGSWYIYDLPRRKDPRLDNLHCNPNLSQSYRNVNPHPIEDQWGIITWAGGPETVIVASRTSINIYLITETLRVFNLPDLQVGENEILLDVKRSASNHAQVFLLTDRCIYWYQIFDNNAMSLLENHTDAATLLLSWKHHMSRDDNTLRLLLSSIEDIDADGLSYLNSDVELTNGSMVVVYSRLSEMAICFKFALNLADKIGCSISDPFRIPLAASTLQESNKGSTCSTLAFRNIGHFALDDREGTSQDEAVENNAFSLVQLSGSLKVTEHVLIHSYALEFDQDHLEWRSTGRKRLHKSSKFIAQEEEDFVVPDSFILEDESGLAHNIAEAPLTSDPEVESASYEHLGAKLRELIEAERMHRPSTGNFEEAITTALESRVELDVGLYTMNEFLATRLPTDEIDTVSSMIQGILDGTREDSANGSIDLPIVSQSLLDRSQRTLLANDVRPASSSQLVQLYEEMLARYIRPLGAEIPPRSRVMLERDIRQIAMTVFLSTHGVRSRRPITTEDIENEQQSESQDQVSQMRDNLNIAEPDTLPPIPSLSIPSPGDRTSGPRSSQFQSSQLPSSPQPQSSQVRGPCSRSRTSQREAPSLSTLRKYTSFSEPSHFPSATSAIVAQWEIGSDRRQFNWQRARENVESASHTTRAQKPKNRRSRSQRSQAPSSLQAAMDTQRRGSSPSLPDLPRSSQAPPRSSQAGPSMSMRKSENTFGLLGPSEVDSSQAPPRSQVPQNAGTIGLSGPSGGTVAVESSQAVPLPPSSPPRLGKSIVPGSSQMFTQATNATQTKAKKKKERRPGF